MTSSAHSNTLRYITGRLLQGAIIVFAVTTFTFLLLQFAPGDPVDALGASASLSPEVAEQQRINFGLDRPIGIRYMRYISNVVRGDLGYSYTWPLPVLTAIKQRIPATVLLALAALIIDFAIGILVGAIQGARRGSRTDDTLSILSIALFSVPVFWLGLMALLVFSLGLGWFPQGGMRTSWAYEQMGFFATSWDIAWHLFLPALTLGLVGAASTARFQRAAMIDAVSHDYVKAARAKGLSERTIMFRHALRNALLPAITLFGISFPVLLSGAVLVEQVFSWPGLGALAVDAFSNRDYPLVTGMAIVVSAMVVVGNLIADLLYRVVDPRIRVDA
ncbi:MAG: ABC transporter permease [Myxococcota bacterium]|nr:ABC transporter permease [Myxococcota bacterium]